MKIYQSALIFLVSLCLTIDARSQRIVKRIELKIAPFYLDYARFDPFVDLDSADLFVTINNSSILNFSNDSLWQALVSSQLTIDDIATDFRVKCIVSLFSGGKHTFYVNRFGQILFNDRYFENKSVAEFVFGHVPHLYRFMR